MLKVIMVFRSSETVPYIIMLYDKYRVNINKGGEAELVIENGENKITLKEIRDILSERGKTKVFEKDYRHFNAGNTNFNNHKEYLFVTEVNYV